MVRQTLANCFIIVVSRSPIVRNVRFSERCVQNGPTLVQQLGAQNSAKIRFKYLADLQLSFPNRIILNLTITFPKIAKDWPGMCVTWVIQTCKRGKSKSNIQMLLFFNLTIKELFFKMKIIFLVRQNI